MKPLSWLVFWRPHCLKDEIEAARSEVAEAKEAVTVARGRNRHARQELESTLAIACRRLSHKDEHAQ